MRILLLIFLCGALRASSAQGFQDPAFLGAVGGTNASANPFTHPTNIANLRLLWDWRTMSTNFAVVSEWTNSILGILSTNKLANGAATNTPLGVYFKGSDRLSNIESIATNCSVWIVFKPMSVASGYHMVVGNAAGDSGFFMNGTTLGFYTSGPGLQAISTSIASGTEYDMLWAHGSTWLNGAAASTTATIPATIPIQSVGNDSFAEAFTGYIKFIGVWTNKTLTATDAANLNTWSKSR